LISESQSVVLLPAEHITRD